MSMENRFEPFTTGQPNSLRAAGLRHNRSLILPEFEKNVAMHLVGWGVDCINIPLVRDSRTRWTSSREETGVAPGSSGRFYCKERRWSCDK